MVILNLYIFTALGSSRLATNINVALPATVGFCLLQLSYGTAYSLYPGVVAAKNIFTTTQFDFAETQSTKYVQILIFKIPAAAMPNFVSRV